jgi:hypothetical protein
VLRLAAFVLLVPPQPSWAQSDSPPAPQAAATAGACAKLGADIPKLAEGITADTTSDSWRGQVREWLIDSIARGMADEVLAGERSKGHAADYVSAYKGSRDVVELHTAEIDRMIRQFEPQLREQIADTVCSRLTADDVRSIAAFLATPAGQRYRAMRQDPALTPEHLPVFVAMARSVIETARGW